MTITAQIARQTEPESLTDAQLNAFAERIAALLVEPDAFDPLLNLIDKLLKKADQIAGSER